MCKVEKQMPTHSENRKLPYSAKQMYSLVADVEKYAEFLPWCSAARIRSRLLKKDYEVLDVDLVISFRLFREKFGSRVSLYEHLKKIETVYIDGPFKHLRSEWSFADETEGCSVNFYVDFELRNALLRKVIGIVFNDAMQKIVSAFEKRARNLYET